MIETAQPRQSTRLGGKQPIEEAELGGLLLGQRKCLEERLAEELQRAPIMTPGHLDQLSQKRGTELQEQELLKTGYHRPER